MNINDPSGWLFAGDTAHVHEITETEVEKLLELALLEDQWTANVRNEAEYYDNASHSKSVMEIMLQQIRLTNVAGTLVQFPFGYFCTFESRRHLFRGENQVFLHSESSLGRRCRNSHGNRRSEKETEILHVLSNMRIVQFRKFIWQFDIIPQWEGKLSEINYKALAQHYGFDTFLLDLTNDVRTALFFATCKWTGDCFEPLTQEDINKSEQSRYGVLYHTPDWRIDALNGRMMMKQCELMMQEGKRDRPSIIDTGRYDGIAYQIGLQPFHRCHTQHGYVYPMKTLGNLRNTGEFEIIHFSHSPALSRRVYEMMDAGKKIYPDEGINEAATVIDQIKKSFVFSEDDLEWAYEMEEARKDLFPTITDLKKTLESDTVTELLVEVYGMSAGCGIRFQKEEVEYILDASVKDIINNRYNDKDFLEPLQIKKYYRTPDEVRWRRERYRQLFELYEVSTGCLSPN